MTLGVPKGLARREVTLLIGVEGVSRWNILWKPKHPKRGGKFVPPHPCADDPKPTMFDDEKAPLADTSLSRFRCLGYFASCFPEGDGISFKPLLPKPADEVIEDIERCFYFKVTNAR